ncbi:hypothetical protein CFP56_039390 [Quercus suber]|uniref:Uncharacterized protein n=1 Tax=Quercus suber TaxID=58331 RepID=A0AAW0LN47_QUESU
MCIISAKFYRFLTEKDSLKLFGLDEFVVNPSSSRCPQVNHSELHLWRSSGGRKHGRSVMSYAHALILAGWDVVVVDKTCEPIKGSPTGAGLGLDPLAQRLVQSWLGQPELLHHSTLPLTIDMVLRNSVTMKVSSEMIQKMHQEAEKVWVPEFVSHSRNKGSLFEFDI